MGKLFDWMQLKAQGEAQVQSPEAGRNTRLAKDDSALPERKVSPGGDGEAAAMGWGAAPGEVAEVAAMARTKFPDPPTDRRGFPHFPTFCKGYGKECGRCRFFHEGRGPFCLVWGEAWPDFRREEKPARCEFPVLPGEYGTPVGRKRMKADVAKVRARLRRTHLEYPDGPDWFAFCGGYPEGCDGCRYYRPELACWCRLWEVCFPGVVRWCGWKEEEQG